MIDRILDFIYPPRCAFCRALLRTRRRTSARACRKRCRATPGTYTPRRDAHPTVLAPRYEGRVRESLLRYKFGGLTAYAAVYAEFLAKCIDENGISCDSITWVPLSRRRLRQRGYDQARLIAEELAKSGWAYPANGFWSSGGIPSRSPGSPTGRSGRNNAAGVYAILNAERVKGKRVLLVDDIVTTGATLASCARGAPDARERRGLRAACGYRGIKAEYVIV